ncbi:MAG: hypothetical protein H6577_09980 [Lewinellaceae bacterium]|nr:hypothetical protein [Saprospiraceae bacterium]MCB9338445.1 hypothetical protein [Lewinellaceae bacterium]
MTKQSLTLTWQGITVEISYGPDWSGSIRKIYGHPLAHLEIANQGRQKLPVTETGYRSHFIASSEVESFGGPEKYVGMWLDDATKSSGWQGHIKKSRQPTLF